MSLDPSSTSLHDRVKQDGLQENNPELSGVNLKQHEQVGFCVKSSVNKNKEKKDDY